MWSGFFLSFVTVIPTTVRRTCSASVKPGRPVAPFTRALQPARRVGGRFPTPFSGGSHASRPICPAAGPAQPADRRPDHRSPLVHRAHARPHLPRQCPDHPADPDPRRELHPARRVLPVRRPAHQRPAHRAHRHTPQRRLAGHRVQPRLHPPNEYRTTERYVAYVDAFARAGFVVLKPDYRGHGSSQGQPAGTSYWSPEYTTDVLNAASSLKTLKGVNKARLGMWGHSMGGHITLRAMVVSPDIKAGVIWAGVVGPYDLLFKALPQWGRGDPNDPRARLLATLGRPERNPAAYRAISPNAYLADLRGRPLQLHHATGDTHVPYSLSQSLASGLKAAGQPVTFYTYAGDNHDLSRNLKAALDRSIAFFKTHL
ncbi:alpha/beta hydrolase family protein [Deinococcus multiflagellatus]|uniref:Alpha/beta fold hydrolase n=1 Tax=Deinococcus multiflagellatus TaxID=1656887 RepID=A0ABW1ZQE3_9DEIO